MSKVAVILILAATLGITGQCWAVSHDAAVRGMVRDAQGAPQIGAQVDLLSADASPVATVFTDNDGHYTITGILPGHYQMRASAAFLMPAIRNHLRLQAGSLAIVDLMMNTLFEAENWLPAQKRRMDEPADDWKWALRSTASRPLLRLVDPNDKSLSISTSSREIHKASRQALVSVSSGDGDFGQGGVQQVFLMDSTAEDGDTAILRVAMGEPGQGFSAQPTGEVSAGYERRLPLGGSTRLVSSYLSHPELTYANGNGLQVMQLATTQQIDLGDAVMIDAGTLMEAERLASLDVVAEPFVRIAVRPSDGLMVGYRYAAGQLLQSSDDLDRVKPQMDILTDANGRPLNTRGSHNEFSISRKLGKRTLGLAVYRDSISHAAISGSGLMNQSDLAGIAMVTDPTTGTFRLASAGYTARGLSVTMTQPLTQQLAVWGEYDLGTALWSESGGTPTLPDLASSVYTHTAQAVSVAVRGKLLRTGTAMKAEYRWQPMRTLTQVNTYNAMPGEGYMGIYIRQRVWGGRILPKGIDAVVEATNLLEEGYQPVLAPDGHTLYLAQLTRMIQGGLVFNF